MDEVDTVDLLGALPPLIWEDVLRRLSVTDRSALGRVNKLLRLLVLRHSDWRLLVDRADQEDISLVVDYAKRLDWRLVSVRWNTCNGESVLHELFRTCVSIAELSVSFGSEHVINFPAKCIQTLRALDVHFCNLDDNIVGENILQFYSFKQLERFTLSRVRRTTDVSYLNKYLLGADVDAMKHFDLLAFPVSPGSLTGLFQISSVSTLALTLGDISGLTMLAISRMTSLCRLSIRLTQLSMFNDGVFAICKSLPFLSSLTVDTLHSTGMM